MYFSTVKELMDNCPIRILRCENPHAEISFLFDSAESLISGSGKALYCCRYTTLAAYPQSFPKGSSLFLFLDDPLTDSDVIADFGNVITVEDEVAYQEGLELLSHELSLEEKLKKGNEDLLEKIILNKSLQDIINHISSMYGRYADILDNALNILAVSSNLMPPDKRIAGEHRFMSIMPNVIKHLRSMGSIEKMRSSRTPIYIEDVPRNTFVYSTSIYIGDVLNVGFLTVFVEKGEKLSPVATQALGETARLLSIIMQRHSVNTTNKATYFTHLLSSMLQGTPAMGSSYKDRFMAFNYNLKKYKRIAVLQLESGMFTSISTDDICETLKPMFPNSVYVVFDTYIVFLFSENTISDIKNSSMLNEFLKHNLLRVGISSPFEDEADAQSYYELAKAALQLGQRLDGDVYIYLYDEYKAVDIINEISQYRSLNSICFRPLIKLIEADAADENMLVETLFTYISNKFSIKKTCEELFIHRNTLYYRFEKIKNIMGCDFMEYPILMDIGITMMILKYLNISPVNIDFKGKKQPPTSEQVR